MKRILFTVLILSASFITAAQNDQQQIQKMKFGLKVGMNLANATGNGVDLFTDGEKSDGRLGLAIGAFFAYEISDKFSLQSELTYSQQGFKKDDSNDNEFVLKLDYLNIPILAKYNLSDNLSVLMGPQIGFLLSSKLERERVVIPLVASKSAAAETDLKEFFKKTDFGLNIGMSYELNSGFGINARYYAGLKDIFDFTSTSTIIDSDFDNKSTTKREDSDYVIKNSVLNLSVFYTF